MKKWMVQIDISNVEDCVRSLNLQHFIVAIEFDAMSQFVAASEYRC